MSPFSVSKWSALPGKKDSNTGAQVFIDGNVIKDLEKINKDKNLYLLPQNVIENIKNAKTLKFVFEVGKNKSFTLDVKPETLEAIRQVILRKKILFEMELFMIMTPR